MKNDIANHFQYNPEVPVIQKPQGKGTKELVALMIQLEVLILMDNFPKTSAHPLSMLSCPSDIPPYSCPSWRGNVNPVVNLESSIEQKAGLCGVIILGIASNPLRLHLTLPTIPKRPIGSTSKSPCRASKTARIHIPPTRKKGSGSWDICAQLGERPRTSR